MRTELEKIADKQNFDSWSRWIAVGNAITNMEPDETPTERLERRITDFANFLEAGGPTIPDESLLPHSKSQLVFDFEWRIEQLNLQAETSRAIDDNQTAEVLEKEIELFKSALFTIKTFTEIDEEDRNLVAYFNSFNSLSEIPREAFNKYVRLSNKYLKKSLGEKGIDPNCV